MSKRAVWGVLAGWLMGLAAVQVYAVPNPAAAYAEQLGYDYEATADGETVTVAPGVALDAWDFYRGKVGSEYAYGARYGYDTVNRTEQVNGSVRSYAVCVPKAPLKTGGAEEVPLLDLMKQNGEPLWVDPERTLPEDLEEILKTAPLKTFPKQELPSSWDWRNVGGSSYIGSVRNQGSCGSCYAFGAAAAAEGTFNYAMNRTGSQCVDFSEAYIAWCLGAYGDYSSHFGGCDGADYDYAELEALTVEGICGENQMPYNNGSDPGYCTYSGTTTVFEAWARVPYGDIDAIKTAIMTHGVVDAAVYVNTAFENYDSGVHDDNNNTCSSGWYTTSNHAISLVGWDDNPPEGGGGVWILRNSWGTSWGESGYMRIRYDAAVVHCAVCYMVYGEVAETAPSFTSGTSFGATTGVARTHTVTASGNPTPALKLQSTTASAGYYTFVTNTGVLTYQPPAVDAGSKTFTFTASNSLGVATQTVTATVTLAPPAAPAAIWASATNTTDFTAAWSTVADATGYRLDVGTNATFTGGGGGGGGSLDISGYDLLQFDSSQTYTLPEGTVIEPGGYVIIARNQDKAAFESQWGVTLAANVVFLNSGGSIPQLNGSETFLLRDASDVTVDGQTALAISGQVTVQRTDATADATSASSWTSTAAPANSTPGTGGVGNGTGGLVINEYSENGTYTYEFVELYYDAISAPPSYVPGYSNKTVSGTSQSVTGLTAGATYYFRARAVNAGGSSPNSSVASVTTLATLSAPVFGANPGPIAATAGVDAEFTVSASGVPTPALILDATTVAVDDYDFDSGTGDVLYIPPQGDVGVQTFTFSASNSQGTASQIVTVNVAAATAPVFTGGAGPYSTTVGVAVAFTVSASGTPAPTLALQSQTASSGYSFTPATGAFTYTPPAGDVGTPTFTFTAANAAGTLTQVTSVSVSAVPTAPNAPTSIWADPTNSTTFTANWSAASEATSYRLDVSTNATFTGGGTSEQFELVNNAATSATPPTDWTYAISASSSSYLILGYAENYVVSEAFSTVGFTNLTVDCQARTYGGTAAGTTNVTVSVSGDNGDTWTVIGIVAPANNKMAAMPTLTTTANLGNSQTRLRWQALGASANKGVGIQSLVVKGWSTGSVPAYVPGYEDRPVAGTSESVTGLVAETAYFFRARAVNGVGTSGHSSTGSVTTLAESVPGTPPVMNAIPAQVTSVGGELDYRVTATATEGDPILSFGCTSAVDVGSWDLDENTGYFLFMPTHAAQIGTNIFTFTATDKDGTSAPVQMSVKVYSAAATNEFTQWVEDHDENPADPSFAPEEDADGDLVSNYDEFLADTDPTSPSSVLRLEGQSADLTEFTFPASPERFYQFVYTADLTSTQTNDIGWGVPGMVVTSTVPGTWFGTIRVLLDDPAE